MGRFYFWVSVPFLIALMLTASAYYLRFVNSGFHRSCKAVNDYVSSPEGKTATAAAKQVYIAEIISSQLIPVIDDPVIKTYRATASVDPRQKWSFFKEAMIELNGEVVPECKALFTTATDHESFD